MKPIYDAIGSEYAAVRKEDARITALLREALAGATVVVNVGAGAGSYEDAAPRLIAVEPSIEMVRQRRSRRPVVRAAAEALPLADASADAAMAVLTMHHWHDWRAGIREMVRVSSGRLVILTYDVAHAGNLWIASHYLPEIIELDTPRFPRMAELLEAMGGGQCRVVPIPHDCTDGFLGAYWRRPEAYLDPAVRRGISVFRQLPEAVVGRGLRALEEDLRSGAWEARFGELRARQELDLGYRLMVSPQHG